MPQFDISKFQEQSPLILSKALVKVRCNSNIKGIGGIYSLKLCWGGELTLYGYLFEIMSKIFPARKHGIFIFCCFVLLSFLGYLFFLIPQ
jgi:hypothetical protein